MKKLIKLISASVILGMTMMIVGISQLPPVHADTRISDKGNGITVYDTTYGRTVNVYDLLIDFITQEYGTDAAEAYIAGVRTGDYYQYRSLTGYWKPTDTDPKLKAHAISGIADPTFYLNTGATSNESFIYQCYGKYGTVADYVAYCQANGVTPLAERTDIPGTDMYAYVFENLALPNKNITKAEYLKNHGATATTVQSTTATSSAVEALKTYKGNTTEFNAYNYYTRYADLQTAIGANGDALLQHYNQYGKAEGRIAK